MQKNSLGNLVLKVLYALHATGNKLIIYIALLTIMETVKKVCRTQPNVIP